MGKEPGFKAVKEYQIEGLPQGSCLSPFLSIVLLDLFMKEVLVHYPGVHYIAYADDVIFYSDADEIFSKFVEDLDSLAAAFGLEVAKSKSTLSKTSGNWHNPTLKFLGLIYDTETDKIRAATRKGSSIAYSFTKTLELERIIRSNKYRSANSALFSHLYWLGSLTGVNQLYYLFVLGLDKVLLDRKKLRRFLTSNEVQWLRSRLHAEQDGRLLDYIWSNINYVLFVKRTLIRTGYRTLSRAEQFNSVFAGLFLARMYNGSLNKFVFDTKSGAQRFDLKKYFPGSLAHCMQSHSKNLYTIHIGTSFAFNILTDLSRSIVLDFNNPEGVKARGSAFSLRRNLKKMEKVLLTGQTKVEDKTL